MDDTVEKAGGAHALRKPASVDNAAEHRLVGQAFMDDEKKAKKLAKFLKVDASALFED